MLEAITDRNDISVFSMCVCAHSHFEKCIISIYFGGWLNERLCLWPEFGDVVITFFNLYERKVFQSNHLKSLGKDPYVWLWILI